MNAEEGKGREVEKRGREGREKEGFREGGRGKGKGEIEGKGGRNGGKMETWKEGGMYGGRPGGSTKRKMSRRERLE